MKKKIIIEGEKVHNVGYRPFLLRKAMELGIRNYDANNVKENGKETVEVLIDGEGRQVEAFMAFARESYPPKARVSEVREAEPPESVMPIDDYDKVLAAEQQNTIVQSGIEMLGKQDQMLGKQDETIHEVRGAGNKVDSGNKTLGEKIDNVGNKVGALDTHMNKRFDTLDDKYGRISSDISKAIKGIEQVARNTEKILEHQSEQQENFTRSVDGLTGAILKLAEKSA